MKDINTRQHVFCLGGLENTLAVARHARRSGADTMYFDSISTSAAFSRCVQFVPLTSADEPEIFSCLKKAKGQIAEESPLIFFNSDPFVRFALNHRKVLQKEFTFLLPSSKVIECALDKKRMVEIFPPHLLPIEYCVECSSDLSKLPLPVIVKPRDTSFGLPFKTKILETRQQAEDFAEHFGGMLEGFLFQEIVSNKPGRLVSIFFYRRTDRGFISVAIERERMNPSWGGVGCLIKKTEFLHTRMLEEVLQMAGYEGLGEIDLFETENSMIMFDLNVRLPGWAFFAEKCGIDLLGMYLEDLSRGALRKQGSRKTSRGAVIRAIDIINDAQTVFHPRKGLFASGKLTITEYLKSLKGVRGVYLFDMHDWGPFLHKIYDEFRVFLKKSRKGDT